MEATTTETETNGSGRKPRRSKAEPTKQQQVPGTEAKMSEALRGRLEAFATSRANVKAEQEYQKAELDSGLLEAMAAEGIDAARVEIDVDDELRVVNITLEPGKMKIKTALEKKAEDE